MISGDTSICPGEVFVLDGGDGIGWAWNNGTTVRYLNATEPGIYQVQVTDENGIIYQTNSITITLQSPPIAEVTTFNPTCSEYTNGIVQFDYTYEENTLLFFNDEVVFNTISNLPAGTYAYSIISQSGCSSSGEVVLQDPEIITTDFLSTNGLCADGFGQLEIFEVVGGTPPYTTDFFGLNPDQLPVGQHLFLLLDSQGCPFVGEFVISLPEPIEIEATTLPQIGDILGQINVVASGGTGELEYFLDDISSGNTNIIEATSGMHTITVVDQNGCSETIEIEVGFEISVVENTNDFELHPNPASDIITLQTSSSEISNNLLVYTSTGALILNQKINSFKTNIDISNWSEGIYLVRLGNQQRMLIKQ